MNHELDFVCLSWQEREFWPNSWSP